MTTTETPQPVYRLKKDDIIRLKLSAWWQGFGGIRGDTGSIIRFPDLHMNDLQTRVEEAIEWCEENQQPCRLLILKPRKEGATTILVAKSYHLLRSSESHLVQIGDQYSTTQTMWTMLKTYQEQDQFDQWGNRSSRFTTAASNGSAE